MSKKAQDLRKQGMAQRIIEFLRSTEPGDAQELHKLAEECVENGWQDLATSAYDIASALENEDLEVG